MNLKAASEKTNNIFMFSRYKARDVMNLHETEPRKNFQSKMHPDRSDLITKDRELLFNVLTSYIIKFKLHFMYIFAYVIFIRFVIRYEQFEFMVNFDLNTI